MAVYFTLTPRIDPEHGPMTLQDIDAGIADYLGVPCDDNKWCCYWYDMIGFRLACGWSFERINAALIDDIRKELQGDKHSLQFYGQLLVINKFLSDNYYDASWWGR